MTAPSRQTGREQGAGTDRVSFIAMTLNCVLVGIGAGLPVAVLLACITLMLA